MSSIAVPNSVLESQSAMLTDEQTNSPIVQTDDNDSNSPIVQTDDYDPAHE